MEPQDISPGENGDRVNFASFLLSMVTGFLMSVLWRPGTSTATSRRVTMITEKDSLVPAAAAEIIGYSRGDLAPALTIMEDTMKMGQWAAVQFCTTELPSEVELAQFVLQASAAGFHLGYPKVAVIGGVPTTTFKLRKGSPAWAALIPFIPIAIIGGLITFGIFRIEALSKALMPILLVIIGGAVILVALAAKPAERVATAFIEKKGALPQLPSTIPVVNLKKAPAAS